LLALALALPLGTAGSALARTLPLLPLAHGQVRVLLGDSPYWLPVSGATGLSLLAGSPRGSGSGLNAYIALQSDAQPCARSANADHGRKLTFNGFFSARFRLPRLSPLAPTGGAQRGVYMAQASTTVAQHGRVRACIWIAPQPTSNARPAVQEIPLLNGLFAASVAALPDGQAGPPSSYSVDAVDVLKPFSYRVSTTVCGTTTSDPRQSVAAGDQASASVTIGSGNCPADASTFSFSAARGRSLGKLIYTVADAGASPLVVAHLGACDLNGAAPTTQAAAKAYVAAVGCRVGRLLRAPRDKSLPRGYVSEVQVDGGIAQIAPRGTKVDLVING
jgi:hypothetical protein